MFEIGLFAIAAFLYINITLLSMRTMHRPPGPNENDAAPSGSGEEIGAWEEEPAPEERPAPEVESEVAV